MDGLGSVRLITDNAGTETRLASYDPYGVQFEQRGTGSSTFGFTGEQTDASGLQFLGARYYDPKSGTFLGQDPFAGVMSRSGSRNGYVKQIWIDQHIK